MHLFKNLYFPKIKLLYFFHILNIISFIYLKLFNSVPILFVLLFKIFYFIYKKTIKNFYGKYFLFNNIIKIQNSLKIFIFIKKANEKNNTFNIN